MFLLTKLTGRRTSHKPGLGFMSNTTPGVLGLGRPENEAINIQSVYLPNPVGSNGVPEVGRVTDIFAPSR